MSMSTHIQAFRDMNGEFKKMLEILLFCREKGVSLPKEVEEYFGDNADYDEDEIKDEMLEIDITSLVRDWTSTSADGYEVDVKDLPKEVKTLRFYNSW